ncbi:MAG: hypothetical protein EPN91_08705 [Salinibacterium sp.]|nr:MAG: hypothetical protein EPN91_08705 [Salinibacterium sp.]
MDADGNLHRAEQLEYNRVVLKLVEHIELWRARASTSPVAKRNLKLALKAYDAVRELAGDDTTSAEYRAIE